MDWIIRMNELWVDVGVGIGLMVFELAIIKIFVDRFISLRQRTLWLPFRSMFYRAVYQYHDELIRIWEFWDERQREYLIAIKARAHLTREDIEVLQALYREITERRKHARSSFHNEIQTSTPSLTPENGPLCHEPMYFDDMLALYSGECIRVAESFDFSQIANRAYADETLKTLWAKQQGMKILMLRFRQYPEILKSLIASSEDLHFYRGNFVPRQDYEQALRGEAHIEEYKRSSEQIPRTTPVKSFFDKDFEI